MIIRKPGCLLTKQTPALAWAAFRVEEIYIVHGVDTLVITSGDDGDHGQVGVPDDVDPKTLHGKGLAHDFRSHDIPRDRLDDVLACIKKRLGPDYDVLLEGRGTSNEHIHCEFQPHR
jgi:hypothetical protein